MNKNLYKVIFNKKRGQMMAVAEIAVSAGKSAGDSATDSSISMPQQTNLNILSFSLMLAVGGALLFPVHAQARIVGDNKAPGNQRPVILNSANGTAQVNIQTPSKAGVSVNQYQQFDVDKKGVILNNSRTNTQTQLGGWVQGNPFLVKGPARVIVNQVNSANPSHLNGYIEVAGQKAEVIIANPAGLRINGGGFINASGVILTTGNPVVTGAGVEAFRVRSGSIDIGKDGLDASGADYTRLISQASQVQGGIWAKKLDVTVGNNDVAANGAVTATEASKGQPLQWGIDVGQLGGMYAGKITLISTDKGVGVNNAGQIFASAGGVTIDANGLLSNKGSMVAQNSNDNSPSAQINIQSHAVENSGTLSANDKQSIQSTTLKNSGLIHTADELVLQQQGQLQNSGNIKATRLDITAQQLHNQKGTITQTGDQALAIATKHISNTDGAILGNKPQESGNGTGGTGTGSGGQNPGTAGTSTGDNGTITTPPSTSTGGGDINVGTVTPTKTYAAGSIKVTEDLSSSGGSVTGNGDVSIVAEQGLSNTHKAQLQAKQVTVNSGDFSNVAAKTTVEQLTVKVDNFDNNQGELTVLNDATHIQATQNFSNQAGKFSTTGVLNVSAGSIHNQAGSIEVAKAVTLSSQSGISNQAGKVLANQDINVVAGNVDNSSGSFISNTGKIGVASTGSINNSKGVVQADGTVDLRSSGLNNQQGKVLADAVNINSGSAILNNDQGQIASVNDIHIQSGALSNQEGQIQANDAIALNTSGQALSNQQGKIIAGSQLDVNSGALDNRDGLLQASTDLRVDSHGQAIRNAQSKAFDSNRPQGMVANTIAINSGDISGTGNIMVAQDSLNITAQDITTPNGMVYAKNKANITANSLNVSQGSLQAGETVDLQLQAALNNDGGHILADSIKIQAKDVSNQGNLASKGGIEANQIGLSSDTLDNRGGRLVSMEDLPLQVHSQLQNQVGLISSNKALSIQGGKLIIDNGSGNISAVENLSLDSEQLLNTGSVITNKQLDINAGEIHNSGELSAAGNQNIHSTNLKNSGSIASNAQLNMAAAGLDNKQGEISAEHVQITAQQLNNQAGVIAQTGLAGLDLDAGVLSNNQGIIGYRPEDNTAQPAQPNTSAGTGNTTTGGTTNTPSTGNGSNTATSNQTTNPVNSSTPQTGNLTNGFIKVAGHLNNDKGGIYANAGIDLDVSNGLVNKGTLQLGDLSVKGDQFINDGGKLTADALSIDTKTASNQAGKIAVQKDFSLNSTGFNNQAGEVAVNGDLSMVTGQLNNQAGSIEAAGKQTVHVQDLDNSKGRMIANKTLDIQAQGKILNQEGVLGSAQETIKIVAAGVLDNTSGQISAANNVSVTVGSLENAKGMVASSKSLTIHSTQDINNHTGSLTADGHTDITAQNLDNTSGQIGAVQGNVNVHLVGKLSNGQDATVLDANNKVVKGTIAAAAGTAAIQAHDIDNDGGVIYADNSQIKAQDIRNRGGEISTAQDLSIKANSLDNSQGTVFANSHADIQLTGALQNQNGTLASLKQLNIASAGLNNTQGTIYSTAEGVNIQTQGLLDNTDGHIAAKEQLQIHATSIHNQRVDETAKQAVLTGKDIVLDVDGLLTNSGDVYSQADARINSQGLDNKHGNLSADGQLMVDVQGNIGNQQGSMTVNGDVTIAATDVNNTSGQIGSSNGNVSLNLQGDLLNDTDTTVKDTSGKVIKATVAAANGVASIAARNVSNQGGVVYAQNTIIKGSDFNNQDGEVSAANNVSLSASSLDNRSGTVFAQDQLNVTVQQALNNSQGTIAAKTGTVVLQAASINNQTGSLYSQESAVNVLSQGGINNTDGYIAAATDLKLSATTLNNVRVDQTNKQAIITANNVDINLAGNMRNSGDVYAKNNAQVVVGALNNDGGNLSAGNDLDVKVQTHVSNHVGNMAADKQVNIIATDFNNTSGQVGSSNGNVTLALSGDLYNEADASVLDQSGNAIKGTVAAANGVADIKASNVSNNGGIIHAGNTNITTGQLSNVKGEISAKQDIVLKADRVDNQAGTIFAENTLSVAVKNALSNTQAAHMAAKEAVSIQAASIDNSGGNLYSVNNALKVSSTGAINNADGYVAAAKDLQLNASSLNNQRIDAVKKQAIVTGDDVTLDIAGLLQNSGDVYAKGKAQVDSNILNNDKGNLSAEKTLNVAVTRDVSNREGRITAGDKVGITGHNLDNTSGQIGSMNQDLALKLSGVLTNDKGTNKGTIAAAQGVSDIQASSISNQGGAIYGLDTKIVSGSINNQKGEISAINHVAVSASSLNNASGTLFAQNELGLNVSGAISANQGGTIGASNAVSIQAASLNNAGGNVYSVNQSLDVASKGVLNNNDGYIGAKTHLNLVATSLDNQRLDATKKQANIVADTINLDVSGNVRNSGDIYAQSQGKLKAGSFNNSSGNVAAADNLNVAVVGNIDNHAGKMNAGNDLNVSAKNLDNTSGALGSAKGNAVITVANQFTNGTDVNSKDASGNALVGTVAVSQGKLDLSAGIINNQDGIVYAKQATVTAKTGGIDNQAGMIQTLGQLTLNSAKDLNNNGGSINAKSALDLKAQNISNAAGQISSDSHNRITATSLTNSDKGQIGSVQGNVTLDLTGKLLNQSQAVIAASQGTASIKAQDIDNDGANISANVLDMTAKNSMTNQNQATLYANSVNLNSVALTNNQATVWSNNGLDIVTKNLIQNSGNIQSQDDMVIKADSLSQTNSSLVAKQGNMSLGIKGDLTNIGDGNGKDITEKGLILAGKDLNITATNVNNTQGNVIAAHVDVDAVNALSNQKGQIAASNTLSISAKSLQQSDNATLSSMDKQTLQIATAIDNNASTIVSNKGLDIDAQTLVNDQGKIVANNSKADITITGRLDNRNHAVIQADNVVLAANEVHNNSTASINAIKDLQLSSKTDLDNQGGLLVSQGSMALNLNGKVLNNQAGLVSSQKALNITASSINNQAGSIETAEALSLSSAGQLNNSAGRVVGNGITINTQSVNNQGGNVISNAGLSIKNSGDFNNSKGYVYANTGIGITAKNIVNTEGTIKSLGDIDLQAGNQLDNSKGWIASNTDVNIKAIKVINNDTLDANNIAMGIQGNIVSVTTQNLDNVTGKIVATDKVALLVENQINNQKGSISSDGQIIMQKSDGTAMNLVDNRDGSIVAKDNTIFKTKQVLNDGGELVFGDNLSLDIDGDYTQTGVLQAGNDANITIGGHLTNEGTLEAQNNLNLKANDLTNLDDAKIVAGQNTTINVKNTINNYGLIDGTHTTIHTSKLNNEGEKARIYGTHLAIEANDIHNKTSDRNGDGVLGTGTIAARERLDIGAKTITNEEEALIYSDGSVHIGGKLDANQHATGMANSITNSSATIESGTDMNIAATTLVNKDTHVKLGTDWVLLSQSGHVREVFGLGYTHQPHENSVDTLRWYSEDELWSPGYEEFYTGIPGHSTYQKFQRPTDYKNLDGSIRFKVWANQAIYLEVKQEDGSWESYSHWLMRSGYKTVEQQNVVDAKPGKIIAGGNMNITGNKWTNTDSQIIAGKAITANITGGVENTSTVTPKQRITFIGDADTKAVNNGADEKFAGQTNCWNGSASFFCLSEIEDALQQGMKGDAYQDEWVDRGYGGKLEGLKDPRFADNDKVYLSVAEQLAQEGGYRDFTGTLKPMNNANAPERTVLVAVDKSSQYDGLHTYIRDDSGVQVRYKREDYDNVSIVAGDNAVSNSIYKEHANTPTSTVNTTQTKVGSNQSGAGNMLATVGSDSAGTTSHGSSNAHASDTSANLNTHANSQSVNNVIVNQQNSGMSRSSQTGNQQLTSDEGASIHTISTAQNTASIDGAAASVDGAQLSTHTLGLNGTAVTANSGVNGHTSTHEGSQTTASSHQNLDSVTQNHHNSSSAQTGQNTDNSATSNQLSDYPNIQQTNQTSVDQATQNTVTVRTALNAAKVPTQSMYSIDPNSHAYLVETDANFTRYNQWLSSDYMLNALNLDPSKMQKRLGDGFYEQKLVNEQINQLTGRAYLSGYSNYEEQYQALMNNGLTFAADFNLTPGVALSKEQLARLTSDIVWLVNQTVTLADGTTQTVLVPQVYVRVQAGDIDGSGALIAADVVNLNITGNLKNQGTIAGRNTALITADNIEMINGKVIGGTVALAAKDNLHLLGSQVVATDNASLSAQNIDLKSTTANYASHIENGTVLDRVAGIYITGSSHDKGALVLAAKGNISLTGAQIMNLSNGPTQLTAGQDIHIGGLTTHQNLDVIQSQNAYNINRSTQQIGSDIQTKGDLKLTSGNDVNIRGSNISSQVGTVDIAAKNDINITTSTNTQFSENYFRTQKKGAFRSSESMGHGVANVVTNNASSVDGVKVNLAAGNNVNIVGSNVISDQLTQIQAGNHINIQGAENTFSQQSESWHKSSGFSGGNMSFTIGRSSDQTNTSMNRSGHVGAMVGSLEGNTNIVAGKQYNQMGSAVSAAKGDVNVQAQAINIDVGNNTIDTTYKREYEKSGFTVAFQSSFTDALLALHNTVESTQQDGSSKNDRVNAMAAANNAMGIYQSGKSMQELGNNLLKDGAQAKDANASVSITYGKQKNVETNETSSNITTPSTMYAGGKVNLVATGAGQDSNINIRGSDVAGSQGTNLYADNLISITSAQDTYSEQSKNQSSGWNAGVAVSYGQSGFAFGVTAGGNYGKGHGNGDDVTHRNSHVGDANSKTSIVSGGTTTLSGGQVHGTSIHLDVGGLNIESLQDTSRFEGEQQNIEGQITVGYGVSGSASYSQSKVNADYAAVGEQSGIFAGDNGYQINVKEQTHLKGGLITSTKAAENAGKNHFSTGSIVVEDIQNHANYDASGFGIGGSADINGGWKGETVDKNGDATSTGKHNMGYGSDHGSDASVTYAGINTQNIIIIDAKAQKALTGQSIEDAKAAAHLAINSEDKDQAAGLLANNFDKEAVQKEINLQVAITKEFSANTQVVIADLDQAIEDKKQAGQDTTNLENASRLLKVVAAGLAAPTDSVLGMAAAAASPEVAREIGQYFKENAELNKIDGGNRAEQGSAAHILAHTVLGAAVAAAGGNDALTAGLAAGGAEAVAPVVSNWLYGTSNPEELTTEQKATISSIAGLAGAGVGGISGGSVSDVVAGGQVAQNAVKNNFLTKSQVNEILNELRACQAKSKNGDCDQADEILYEAKIKSSKNIALIQKYILEGNTEAMNKLINQAATSSEVRQLIPRGYGAGGNGPDLVKRQNNVRIFESVKGSYSIFGTDVQQAQESNEFRNVHCSGLTNAQCNSLIQSAWDAQYSKYYAVMAVSTLLGGVGVRPKSVPRLAQLPKNTVDSLKNKVVNTNNGITPSEIPEVNNVLKSDRVGSGLKADIGHRSASYLSKTQLESGKLFKFTGGDGVQRTLLQTKGELDGAKGIFEYIIEDSNKITHQRFIKGGVINGIPNQKVPKNK